MNDTENKENLKKVETLDSQFADSYTDSTEIDINAVKEVVVEKIGNEIMSVNMDLQEKQESVRVIYPYINENGKRKASLWTRFVKRTFDFCSSLCLFLFLNVTLIFPILMITVAIKMKGDRKSVV